MRVRRLFRYFQRLFPSATGFSPYRFPGLAAHLPILGAFLVLGWSLCGGHGYFWPLLVIYFIAGLYLGRDWAIQAHYNAFILVGAWLGFFFCTTSRASRVGPPGPGLRRTGWWLAFRVPSSCFLAGM